MLALIGLIGLAGCASGSGPAPSDATTGTTAGPTVATVRPAPGDQTVKFIADGSERSYRIHAPASYGPGIAMPVVLVFHGSPGSPDEIHDQSKMDDVADTHGFLVVYPDHFSDTESVVALLDHLVPTWNVDQKRIYAAGFSRGGSLVYRIAQQLSARLAAVAPVSAVGATGVALERPISLITFQGGRDSLSVGFQQTNAAWAMSAQCGQAQDQTITMEGGPTYISSSTCAGGAEHVIYSVARMAHIWPIDASTLVWDFFSRHPLP